MTTRIGGPLAEAGVLGLTGADLGLYARFFAHTASALGDDSQATTVPAYSWDTPAAPR